MGIDMNNLRARAEKLAAKSKFDADVAVSMMQEAHEELHADLHADLRLDPENVELQSIHKDIHEFLVEREGYN